MNLYRTPKPVKTENGNYKNDDETIEDFSQTNLRRYQWVHKIHFHFREVLNTERPLEFLNRMQSITESIKLHEERCSDAGKMLEAVTDVLKIVISIKPRTSFDLKRNKDFNNELRKLYEIPGPKITSDSLLHQLSIEPKEDTMKLAVSKFIEGLFYGSTMIEVFAKIQIFASNTSLKTFPASYNLYKGFEMIYVLIDRNK